MERVVRRAAAARLGGYTDPEHLPNWMAGPEGWSMPVCEIDLRPGGTWHFVWRKADGEEMAMTGTYREVEAPERLVQTESWGDDWPETLNTLVFTEEPDGTTRITTTIVYPSKEARDAAMATGMKEGARPELRPTRAVPRDGLLRSWARSSSITACPWTASRPARIRGRRSPTATAACVWSSGRSPAKRAAGSLRRRSPGSARRSQGEGRTTSPCRFGAPTARQATRDGRSSSSRTSRRPRSLEGGVYTFVSDGIDEALERAQAVADGKDVCVMEAPTSAASTSPQVSSTSSRSTSSRSPRRRDADVRRRVPRAGDRRGRRDRRGHAPPLPDRPRLGGLRELRAGDDLGRKDVEHRGDRRGARGPARWAAKMRRFRPFGATRRTITSGWSTGSESSDASATPTPAATRPCQTPWSSLSIVISGSKPAAAQARRTNAWHDDRGVDVIHDSPARSASARTAAGRPDASAGAPR